MKFFNRQFFVNAIIIVMVCSLTITIMLLSFASKALRYQETAGTVPLKVQKKEYQISAQTIGTVSKVAAQPGQHVNKGDELVELTNVILDKQLSLLQQLAPTNGSASIQLVDLETQKAAQHVYAPTNGVVSDIVSEGEPVNTLQTVATVYSDDSVSLMGQFSLSDYSALQQNGYNLVVTDERLHADYPVQYVGPRQVISTQNNPNANLTLVFNLTNTDDAMNLLENEKVLLRLSPMQQSNKPIDQFLEWYKAFIGNTSS